MQIRLLRSLPVNRGGADRFDGQMREINGNGFRIIRINGSKNGDSEMPAAILNPFCRIKMPCGCSLYLRTATAFIFFKINSCLKVCQRAENSEPVSLPRWGKVARNARRMRRYFGLLQSPVIVFWKDKTFILYSNKTNIKFFINYSSTSQLRWEVPLPSQGKANSLSVFGALTDLQTRI